MRRRARSHERDQGNDKSRRMKERHDIERLMIERRRVEIFRNEKQEEWI